MIFCTIKGFHKGFIRVMFSLVSFFLVILFVNWATPYISDFIETNTSLVTTIQKSCEEKLRESASNSLTEEAQTGTDSLTTAGISLPATLQEQLIGQSVNAAGELLENAGVYDQIAYSLAHFILNGISFFIALAASYILVHFISGILNLVSHLPIIHGMNKMLGIAAGAIQGLVVVWVFFYLIAICCTSDFGMLMVRYIDESIFLTYLYNNNGLLQIITGIF